MQLRRQRVVPTDRTAWNALATELLRFHLLLLVRALNLLECGRQSGGLNTHGHGF